MNYLIIPKESDPFYTNWFDVENRYVEGMIVFNLLVHMYTKDGINWQEIIQDHL